MITTSASGSARRALRPGGRPCAPSSARTGSISTTVTRPPSPARALREALADPAVADDAELARRRRATFVSARIAVSVVCPVPYGLSNMCLQRASFAAIAGKGRRPSASSARSRATPVVVSSLTPRQPLVRGRAGAARCAARQLGAVVDHELGAAVGDREQVGGELVGDDAVTRVHLDAALDERRADGVLRRERVRPGGDDLGAGLAQREHEARGLRLEVHDDGDALPAQAPRRRAVRQRAAAAPACAASAHSMRRSPSRARAIGSAIRDTARRIRRRAGRIALGRYTSRARAAR